MVRGILLISCNWRQVWKPVQLTTTSRRWVENTVSFDEVSVGARRRSPLWLPPLVCITSTGAGRLHPDNYDFSEEALDGIPSGGFPFTIENSQVEYYQRVNNIWTVGLGDLDKNRMRINKIYEGPFTNTDLIAYVSNTFPVIAESDTSVNVEIDISVTGMPTTTARAIVIADNGTNKLAFNPSQGNLFEPYDPERRDLGSSHSLFY